MAVAARATPSGRRVAVTAGSPTSSPAAPSCGADVLVNYRGDDFVAGLRDATDGRGADVVLDNDGREVPVPATSRCSPPAAGSSSSGCRAAPRPRSTSGPCCASGWPCTAPRCGPGPAREKAAIVRAGARAGLADGRPTAPCARSCTALRAGGRGAAHRAMEDVVPRRQAAPRAVSAAQRVGCLAERPPAGAGAARPAAGGRRPGAAATSEHLRADRVVVVAPQGMGVAGRPEERGAARRRDGRAAGQGDADRQHDQAAARGGPRAPRSTRRPRPARRDPRVVDARARDGLAPELVEELRRIVAALQRRPPPSDAELRIAQAQLVGWLEGLFHGIQTDAVRAADGRPGAARADATGAAGSAPRGSRVSRANPASRACSRTPTVDPRRARGRTLTPRGQERSLARPRASAQQHLERDRLAVARTATHLHRRLGRLEPHAAEPGQDPGGGTTSTYQPPSSPTPSERSRLTYQPSTSVRSRPLPLYGRAVNDVVPRPRSVAARTNSAMIAEASAASLARTRSAAAAWYAAFSRASSAGARPRPWLTIRPSRRSGRRAAARAPGPRRPRPPGAPRAGRRPTPPGGRRPSRSRGRPRRASGRRSAGRRR